ncbi:bacillithiol system redox-active protein YtxJ [Sphingobacterium shayense]|uniref:bacillithiol system redox-active protein YtxJ n=1 Tax=Sphingobacterium shayense TaxID=626343 RepID=UPI00155254C4|nr:bacillithiol system redox-active protein YtxJ [Sphingobacterium shayense]NQD70690.1 bacillithiol system redox-active protein YtxJ [Sphingobacterium shayense]
MHWETLSSVEQLKQLAQKNSAFIIFKHSTRCSVSSMAKRNLTMELNSVGNDLPIYYLDLIALREVSNYISSKWNIRHESPQILVLKGDSCLYHASHSDIELEAALMTITE